MPAAKKRTGATKTNEQGFNAAPIAVRDPTTGIMTMQCAVLERFLGRGEQGYVEAREIGERGRQLVVERGRPENRMEDVVMLSW